MPGVFEEYRGNFKRGMRDGKGTLRWDEVTVYTGDFKDDVI